MSYISLSFYILVGMTLILYYVLPVSFRWLSLLLANVVFIMAFHKTGWWILCGVAIATYLIAVILSKGKKIFVKKVLLIAGILIVILPWIVIKNGALLLPGHNLIVPIGISFYSLQLISYLVDVYNGDSEPERNIFRFLLFVTFFPQIIQGPIPRFNQLHPQLVEGHLLDQEKFCKGFYLIVWGFFLKWMIADKAALVVNTVFDQQPAFRGSYIWIGSILYSIQLYADFKACTTIARGVSYLFGIELVENFIHPYLATSVKDFWRRWHISLSSWLRDYIYIPLGGNRRGIVRKLMNILITFLVSGIWHGSGLRFLIWGLLHALFQIVEEAWDVLKKKSGRSFNASRWLKIIWTFFWVNLAWIVFRADTLKQAYNMIISMFTDYNLWVLFNDSLLSLGLSGKEWIVLIISIMMLLAVSIWEERGVLFTSKLYQCVLPIRWLICIMLILSIAIFGTYGYGFDANDFIYGAF